ncbi:MAG: secretin N-terminal domain-containing protein [Verrucomicrobiota bacterium]
MKSLNLFSISAAIVVTGILHAQTPDEMMIEPVAPAGDLVPAVPESGNSLPESAPAPISDLAPDGAPSNSGGDVIVPVADPSAPVGDVAAEPGAPFAPLEQQKQEMEKSEEGYIIKDAGLNDIFQFLAKSAGRQYFHNVKISGPDYLVTGHLNDGSPLAQMEELAFQYGLSLHTKGNTIYALTQAQLSQLPGAEFHYQLRYLRPTDMDQIKELIKPMLTPGSGIVNFEPKTNTIIIIDSAHRIEQARELLHGIDKVQGQVVVETKILRVNTTAAQRTGVDWAASLGETGTSLSVARDLNSVFGLPQSIRSSLIGAEGSNLVLSPVQVDGVLRALAEGGLASQISNPTLITEDNEQATISIIDRIPIITQTQSGTGDTAIVTEEVRYKIDTEDKTITEAPDKHREIGISLVVTPTLLPDGTIRMKLRPRSAQIVERIKSITGNEYPRVTEAMIESMARVPDGYSLVVGGFYGEMQTSNKNKIPLLGDMPLLNFFFKSDQATKEHTSLVFVVTPKSYDPANGRTNNQVSDRLRAKTILDCDSQWINEDNPGPAHEPNLKRSIRGLQPTEAPYYPRPEELAPSSYSKPAATSAPRFSRAGKR